MCEQLECPVGERLSSAGFTRPAASDSSVPHSSSIYFDKAYILQISQSLGILANFYQAEKKLLLSWNTAEEAKEALKAKKANY